MSEITNPPTVPEISTPVPQRTDPENFSVLMDRFLREMPVTVDGINIAVQWTYDTAQLVQGFSQAAAKSVDDAAQQVELAKKEVQLAKQEASKARDFAHDSAVSAAASEQARQGVEQLVDAITGEIGLPETGVVGAALVKAKIGVAFSERKLSDLAFEAPFSPVYKDRPIIINDAGNVTYAKARLGSHALAATTPVLEVASNVTALTYQVIGIDTSTTTRTVTLPVNPTTGDWVSFYDAQGTWEKNNPVIARNGQRIMGKDEDLTVDIKGDCFTLTYLNEARGWVITA